MAKVLLVEDDDNLREIYQARLMAEGYDITTAQNGEDALVVAKQTKPDLIISDVMMPRISGFEMLDILRNTAELKSTKVIMLTALGQAEDQARADSLGALNVLVKSQVTLEDIVNTAKELLDDGSGAMPAAPAATDATSTTAAAPDPLDSPTPGSVTAAAPTTTPGTVDTAPTAPTVPSAVDTPTPTAPVTTTAALAVAPEPVQPPADTAAPVATAAAPADQTTVSPVVTPVAVEPATPVTTPVVSDASEPAPAPAEAPVAVTPEPADVPVVPAPAADQDVSSTSVVAPSEGPASTAVSDSIPQSIEAEEAALQAQIDSFASQPTATEPAAPIDSAPTTESAAPANDVTMQKAVDELNQSATPEPAPAATPAPVVDVPVEPAPTPAPTAPDAAGSNNVTIAGKKIIQPLEGGADGAPDLNALLAKEEASEAASAAAPAATPAPVVDVPVEPAPTPAPTAPAPAAPPAAPAAPPATPGFDPRTVAL